MPQIKDYKDKENDSFKVIKFLRVTKGERRYAVWECQCKLCNKIVEINSYRLGKAKELRCECQIKDRQCLIGQTFGYLTVINEFKGTPERRGARCLCKCVCGKESTYRKVDIRGSKNRQGYKSCGCKKYPQGLDNKNRMYRRETSDGYVTLYEPNHPNVRPKGRGLIFEHVFVMSNYLGRPLEKGETVHHKNGRRNQNNIENLELWPSNHGKGQRAEDLLKYAYQIIEKYEGYQNPANAAISSDWFELEK